MLFHCQLKDESGRDRCTLARNYILMVPGGSSLKVPINSLLLCIGTCETRFYGEHAQAQAPKPLVSTFFRRRRRALAVVFDVLFLKCLCTLLPHLRSTGDDKKLAERGASSFLIVHSPAIKFNVEPPVRLTSSDRSILGCGWALVEWCG